MTCWITSLTLRGCRLGDKGCAAVCAGVRGASRLKRLDLTDNALGDHACEAVASMLSSFAIRRCEDTWETSLRGRKAQGVVASGIRTVILTANPGIGDLGAIELGRALENDNWVIECELRGCGLTELGYRAMVSSARGPP